MARNVFAHAAAENSRAIAFSGKIEAEFAGLSDEEADEFRRDFGITSGGLDQLIVQAYDLLGLMTFLTTGEKETRAWTIEKNTRAPQAAGKIHSDIERGFIRAEICTYADFVAYKSREALRTAGYFDRKARTTSCKRATSSNFASTCKQAVGARCR